MTSTEFSQIFTSSGESLYELPEYCEFECISKNGVLVGASTQGSTNQTYTAYSYAGSDEEAVGNIYYEGVEGTIGIFPVPTVTNKPINIRYQRRPYIFSSDDINVNFTLQEDWIELVETEAMSQICKSGNNPDIELANNYTLEANEIRKKMKLKQANVKARTPRVSVSYKEGWC